MFPRCKEMASRLAEQRSVTDFYQKSVRAAALQSGNCIELKGIFKFYMAHPE
jgi:hypothetical protein